MNRLAVIEAPQPPDGEVQGGVRAKEDLRFSPETAAKSDTSNKNKSNVL